MWGQLWKAPVAIAGISRVRYACGRGNRIMALSLDSPRFSLRSAKFEDIDAAVDEVGHAVLDDVWNPAFLADFRRLSQSSFERDDARYSGRLDQYPKAVIDVYLGSTHQIDYIANGNDVRSQFFLELERSGLPALFHHLFKGDFFVEETERVIRRTDPQFPMRFIGLHTDGQIWACAKDGIKVKRALTLWSPLQDCDNDDTPRLLLLHKGQSFYDLMDEHDSGRVALHTDLTKYEGAGPDKADAVFEKIYASRDAYAPRLPLCSAILFDHAVTHGAYRHARMTVPRYSLDFRVTGRYRLRLSNGAHEGVLYRSYSFPNNKPLQFFSRAARKVRIIAKQRIGRPG